jgi:hypothetical protein
MRQGAHLPGPPPAPPADLAARRLPVVTTAAGSTLFRIHRTALGALYFGPRTDPNARQRWDSPDDQYGVCYFGGNDHVAFAETMLRNLAEPTVTRPDLDVRALASIDVLEPIRLVKLYGNGLRLVGATAAVVHASYDLTWAWSAALHDHPRGVDGIRYHARHDDAGYSIALFDRAAHKIGVDQSVPLLHPALARQLGRWLDRYAVGISGWK